MLITEKKINNVIRRVLSDYLFEMNNANNNDEFYTRGKDVVRELSNFRADFNGKTIYCPCDNPATSEFYLYFKKNFGNLNLSGLYATFMSDTPQLIYFDGVNEHTKPIRSGRFQDNTEYIKQCDIVVTNPPFSDQQALGLAFTIMDMGKDFIMVVPSSILRKEKVFTLLKNGTLGVGYSPINHFIRPNGSDMSAPTCWLTTLRTNKQDFLTGKTYDETKYKKYDNYDAIDCGTKQEKTSYKDIPDDYDGCIGVSSAGLRVLNPNQYEIVDILDTPVINGRRTDTKFIIRRKKR